MRVVNRTDFLKLPEGTLYCKGAPWHFGNTEVKGQSLTNDWYCHSINWPEADGTDEAIALLESGKSFPMQETEGRDGCFDPDALFLIYEPADLEALIALCRSAISTPGSGQ